MNKNKSSDLRKTLDAKHKDIIKNFKERKKSLPQKKKEINNLKKILEKETDFEEIFLIEKKISDIVEEISQIENNKEEDDYFLKTSDLLYKYYCPKENLPDNESDDSDESGNNMINTKTKSISYYFNQESDKNGEKKKINNNNKKSVNKAKILDKFLMITEVDHIPTTINKQEICDSCQTEMEIKKLDGIIVCTTCGFSKLHTTTSNKPSYKESIPENNYFAYKRINHFNEWLSQFQAKESTDIPQEVFDLLIQEIKKARILNMAKVSPNKIREYLKKLGLNKYYEHTAYILNRLNGETPPTMTRETEEKLRVMFREIQYPFMKHCPKKRVNFLSYSYVLHKFVELLGLDEYIKCFPLLKSRNKLEEQDKIWLNICKELKWEYIASM